MTPLPGFSGSLLCADVLVANIGPAPAAVAAAGRLRPWHRRVAVELGPATTARGVFDRLADPLLEALGFSVELLPADSGAMLRAIVGNGEKPCAGLVVTPWGQPLSTVWREAVLHGIRHDLRWSLCTNGVLLRVVDARRTYARRFAEFDLAATIEDASAFAVFWQLLGAPGFEGSMERALRDSEQYRAQVRASLQLGVHRALGDLLTAFSRARGRRAPDLDGWFDESLIVVYRVLFLLFAEARGLVPRWHPLYRDAYTIAALGERLERNTAPGAWESLQAISRLAHQGCRAGTLVVPPFNGRLFSPAHAPLAETATLDDRAVRQALLALTTRSGKHGRERISYADLGVEQLGGVYERILDFSPAVEHGSVLLVRANRRKTTGSFYTPRSMTEYLVRRTLAPLTDRRSAEEILRLRVVDPAMGSGAFLVAACRYLAGEYERALLSGGGIGPEDLSDADRAGFRRTVAQRCLFGVDLNPMAVQLARLSLWLATLAAGRPLTFLDHHLRAGNSLVGASLDDVARQLPGGARRPGDLPLFDDSSPVPALHTVVGPRRAITEQPGDTVEQVRQKERALARLTAAQALRPWTRTADLWCAAWFGLHARRGLFRALADDLLGRGRALPTPQRDELLAESAEIALRERFFHWTLEFPEVFFDGAGNPLANPGFDAVIGNPPWEMLRAESASKVPAFARGSGIYAAQGDGHANLYQFFVERALALAADRGRVGLIVPSGFASDHGCARLRRHLLERARVDTFVSVDNRDGLFPIHRGLKFLLISATRGETTAALRCRFGVRATDSLDGPAETSEAGTVEIPRALIDTSGDQCVIPEFRSQRDADIFAKVAGSIPPLASESGWRARFGRELNASDDKRHFLALPSRSALPIIEGKQVLPFIAKLSEARFGIRAADAARLLPGRPFDRARLAYRDVAAATNKLTLIAAVLPAGCVTTHTLFCLKEPKSLAAQHCLAALLNSYVANYLARMQVGTHVTISIVGRLPVPLPGVTDHDEMARLALRLSEADNDEAAQARVQALAARLYGLTGEEFRHVLGTFPLVEPAPLAAALAAFEAMS